ncbi:class E sortase [Streptomyces kasugaensis]|uniref:Class E sortase n=1 Tax=Streptomyces kasugaensis TaxID=1946 RepID=A0A4Q9HYG2_STRKA|nr:class E sortase [Streptomyces kasugaensis]TBO60354.1 class E sortase [Streptomyces kasugaensis]
MTALRPEREGRAHEPHEPPQQPYEPQDPYGRRDPFETDDAFEAAVGQLDDPLNDPLPGRPAPAPAPAPYGQHRRTAPAAQPAPPAASSGTGGRHANRPQDSGQGAPQATQGAGRQGSPWFRPHQEPEPPVRSQPPDRPQPQHQPPPPQPYEAAPPQPRPYVPEPAGHGQGHGPGYTSEPTPSEPISAPYAVPRAPAPARPPSGGPRQDDETMALRQAEELGATRFDGHAPDRETDAVSRETTDSRETAMVPSSGGRAARRKAAQEAAKRGGKRGRHGGPAAAGAAAASDAEPAPAPTSRLAARRAERAAKDSPSLILSRAVGEVFITLGVLMLLFVTYQLWWTNVLAQQQAGGAANTLQHEWSSGAGEKKNLAAGERFAIMYIPKLDVKVPIAEGIDKHSVLDHGMVGHYDERSGIKTAMPWDAKGNFAVAGHRNTHGEPFRYINKLTKGDKIVVETQGAYYTFEMESILPQTSPKNVSVIQPVPQGSGFSGPGRYITLTTCTPEFTSTYRMIVWGKMVDERPRSKGKPDALDS